MPRTTAKPKSKKRTQSRKRARTKSTTRVYKASPHARFTDKEAQWIGSQIEAHGGWIKPAALVDLARDPQSPIHKLYEWDDRKAGEAYRVEQARAHLRMITVEIVYENKPESIRAFLPVFIDRRDGTPPERAHVATDKIRDTPDLARQVIEGAAREIKLWRRRYERYERVFGPIFQAVDRMEM